MHEYRDALKSRCDFTHDCLTLQNEYHAYTYDGIWALALALDSLVVQYAEEHDSKRWRPELLDEDERELVWFERNLLDALERTSFQGLTVCRVIHILE